MDRYLTINQAAVLTGVDRRTIYRWIKNGRLTATRIPSGKLRIESDHLFQGLSLDAGTHLGQVPHPTAVRTRIASK
jgi:excisionase family DNA binding protein